MEIFQESNLKMKGRQTDLQSLKHLYIHKQGERMG